MSRRRLPRRNISVVKRLLRLEHLERRLLLTAGSNGLSHTGLELPYTNLAHSPDAYSLTNHAKVSSQLWSYIEALDGTDNNGSDSGGGSPSGTVSVQIDERSVDRATNKINLVADIAEISDQNLAQVVDAGATISFVSNGYGIAKPTTLEVWATPEQIASLSNLAIVRSLSDIDYAAVRTGTVNSTGDTALLASSVRTAFAGFGVDGSGVKVGVISDGADHRTYVGSDLPAITLNPYQVGSGDEGTAMLEIVHDLAPGAALYFSGPRTSVEMVDAINWMRAQGVNVIVDDLGFYGQPYFVDGSVALAARNAVAAGVTYVSAAGNDGQRYYQTTWNSPQAGAFVDIPFTLPANGTNWFDLQWSDDWAPTSLNDFRMQVLERPASVSSPIQSGSAFPYDSLQITNDTGAPVQWTLRISVANAISGSRTLKLLSENFDLPANVATSSGQIYGHPAVDEVISVGAINASDPGNDDVESYSSRGGSLMLTNSSLQNFVTRNSLDVAGVDGVYTRVGQLGYFSNTFWGTSAAAPHVAAIAALLLDASGMSLLPSQVSSALRTNANDIGTLGYDNISGAGRANALQAAFDVFVPPVAAAPDLSAASDSGQSNSDNLTNLTTLTFTGVAPAGAYVRLFVDGQPLAATQLAANGTSYTLTVNGVLQGLHSATATFAASASANQSAFSPQLSFTVDTTAPALSGTLDLTSSTDSGISNTDNVTNATNPAFQIAGAASLSRLVRSDGAVMLSYVANGTFTISAQPSGVFNYQLYSIDAAGNLSSASANVTVTFDRTAPAPPPAPTLSAASDSGISQSDRVTNANTLQLSAVGAPYYRLYVGGGVLISSPYQSGWTNYSASPGTPTFFAEAVDAAGNLSAASEAVVVTVDRTSPTVVMNDILPVSRTTSVSSANFTFSEAGIQNFDLPDLTLTKNSSTNLLTTDQTISFSGNVATLNSLGLLTASSDNFALSFNTTTAGITDTAGNALVNAGTLVKSWTVVSWQNPVQPVDVIPDGTIAALDVLTIVNLINAGSAGSTIDNPHLTGGPPPYYDVSGDDLVSALDSLLVINYINSQGSTAPASAAPSASQSTSSASSTSSPSNTPRRPVVSMEVTATDLQGKPVRELAVGQEFLIHGYAYTQGDASLFASYVDLLVSDELAVLGVETTEPYHASGELVMREGNSEIQGLGGMFGFRPDYGKPRHLFSVAVTARAPGVAHVALKSPAAAGLDAALLFGADQAVNNRDIQFGTLRIQVRDAQQAPALIGKGTELPTVVTPAAMTVETAAASPKSTVGYASLAYEPDEVFMDWYSTDPIPSVNDANTASALADVLVADLQDEPAEVV